MAKDNNINYKLFFVFAIIILIFLTGIFSYYVFFKNKNSGTILFTYSNDNDVISIENSLPIEDSVGKKLSNSDTNNKLNGYFEFVLSAKISKNSSIDYEIVAKKASNNNEISDQYIKIYLTDGDSDLPVDGYNLVSVPTYAELKNSASDSRYKVLYSGKFKNNKDKKFILRMWLADNYVINDNLKYFSIKLDVNVNN